MSYVPCLAEQSFRLAANLLIEAASADASYYVLRSAFSFESDLLFQNPTPIPI